MPLRLKIIGAAYCLLGALALLGMLRQAFAGAVLNFDLSVFMLPVGIGLLRGKRSSRLWATFWSGFLLATVVGLAVLMVFPGGGFVRVQVLGVVLTGSAASALGWLTLAAIAALCIAAIWVLYTPPVSLVFSQHKDDGASPA